MQNIGDISQINNLSAEFDKTLEEDLQNMSEKENLSVEASSKSNAIKIVAQKKETIGDSHQKW